MGAITQVDICNLALAKLGSAPITSITQNTERAIVLNAVWDILRKSTLRAHNWNFASKRVALTAESSTPVFEYGYQYTLPSDHIRTIGITDDSGNDITEDTDFAIEDDKLLTDETTVYLKYIYDHEDPSEWDALFADAFSWRLAMATCMRITGSRALLKDMAAGYREFLSEARSFDGMEGSIKALIADDWTGSSVRG